MAGLDKAGVVRLESLEQHASTAEGDLGSDYYQPVTQGGGQVGMCQGTLPLAGSELFVIHKSRREEEGMGGCL